MSVESLKKQVGSLFSVKRLKKKLGDFLVLKDWNNKLGHFLVFKDWKKSWVELETTFITNRQSPIASRQSSIAQAEILELAASHGVDCN